MQSVRQVHRFPGTCRPTSTGDHCPKEDQPGQSEQRVTGKRARKRSHPGFHHSPTPPYSLRPASFITSATNFVVPVTRIDGQAVGDGAPGALTRRIRDIYIETRRAAAI